MEISTIYHYAIRNNTTEDQIQEQLVNEQQQQQYYSISTNSIRNSFPNILYFDYFRNFYIFSFFLSEN